MSEGDIDMNNDDSSSDEDEEEGMEAGDDVSELSTEIRSEVYLPGKPLGDGEQLVCDQSAYIMLHQAQTGAPCLSFDVIRDSYGDSRENYPMTAYIVAGTQAAAGQGNSVIVMKLSNMHKTGGTEEQDDDEEDEEQEEDESKDPKMAGALIKHNGCVNRIRSTILNDSVLAATWSEQAKVNIWNISQQLQIVDNDQLLAKYNQENTGNSIKPMFSFSGHHEEGYGIDWCQTQPGVLATGDCKRSIHIWYPTDNSASWRIDQRPLHGHTASVEDLQWSPNERNVLASCSVDHSIRIWDTRAASKNACQLTCTNAHNADVNVISWNKNEPFIASGGDDGFLKIWDLRRFKDNTPVAIFKHHTASVTSVEWHPTDSPVFASSGEDNQIALWDLSVEKDTDTTANTEVEGLPPQLLFIHQGQKEIKELHWHAQLPGVVISTASTGFNIFRTISV